MMISEEKFEIEGGLQPMKVKQSTKASDENFLDRVLHVWVVVKEHILYHRTVSIAACLLLGLLVAVTFGSRARGRGVYEPKVEHDFSDLKDLYELKKAEIDHWCLGGGNECACNDPTEAQANDALPGWTKAHKMNKELADSVASRKLDVVFLGDDTTEEWNGRWMGESPSENSTSLMYTVITEDLFRINRLWKRTFTTTGGGKLDGLALGIYGDTVGNLLWRLQHGEMPTTLSSKVWWILVGSNDLVRSGCSEEAVILGILRVAEEIAARDKNAKVVLQGLLPRASSPDGSLVASRHSGIFHRNIPAWWLSIELINKELQRFCQKHKNFYFFDASSMLLGQISNEHFTSESKHIMPQLMPDYVHLSYLGHKIVSKEIVKKLNIILQRGDDAGNASSSSAYEGKRPSKGKGGSPKGI